MNDLSAKELYASLLRQKAAIESLQMELMPLREQLTRLIRQSAPKDVRAVSYDPNKGGSAPTAEMALIERIAHVSFQIGEREKDLLGLKDAYAVTVRVMREVSRKTRTSGELIDTVFEMAFVDGHSNSAIAREIGLGEKAVEYYKTKIYALIQVQ